MDKHRKITVNDLTPEIINQLQEKFNAVPEIVQLHAKMHMFLQNHQAIKALSIGKHIQEAFNKVLAAYVDEVNNEAELVDIRNTGLSKDEVAYCAYEDAWRHFLKLRSSHAVSGKPHPNISSLADTLEEVLNELTEKQ